jgi:hypothetical protein
MRLANLTRVSGNAEAEPLPWLVRALSNHEPLGFRGGDANVRRYVRNNTQNAKDLTGLAGILDFKNVIDKDDDGVHLGRAGAYYWPILWKVPEGSNGVIIQRVDITLKIDKDTKSKRYWEGWKVKNGVVSPKAKGLGGQEYDDTFEDGVHPRSKGWREEFAKAWFFENTDMPPGFLPYNPKVEGVGVKEAGKLPSTTTRPTLPWDKAGNEVIRHIKTEWDSTGGNVFDDPPETIRRFIFVSRGIVDVNNDTDKELKIPRPDRKRSDPFNPPSSENPERGEP